MENKKKPIWRKARSSSDESLLSFLLELMGQKKVAPQSAAFLVALVGFFGADQQKLLKLFRKNPHNKEAKAKATRVLNKKLQFSPAFSRFVERSKPVIGKNRFPTKRRKQAADASASFGHIISAPLAGPKKAEPKRATPKKAARNKSAPKKTIPSKHSPKKAAPKKTPPKKAAPKRKAAKKAAIKAARKKTATVPAPAYINEPLLHYFGRESLHFQPDSESLQNGLPAPVLCHFQASMDNPALLDRALAITMVLSREEIGILGDGIAASASANVNIKRELTVNCRSVRNFKPIGQTKVRISVPESDQPITLIFNGKCTAVGPCELAIDVWQGQLPICSLSLKPQCVTKRTGNDILSVKAISSTSSPLAKPLHQLQIRERISGADTFYDFTLDSPGLNIFDEYDPVRIDGDREKYVASLYSEIETMWQLAVSKPDEFQRSIRRKGADLFSTLIPEKLKNVLWQHKDKIDSIQVVSTEPFIPWELVLVKDPGSKKPSPGDKFLCEMGLVRWLFGWRPAEQLSVRQQKSRYVIPVYLNPARKLTASDLERAYLEKVIGATPVVPTPEEVGKLLNEKNAFDLLHFSCHAEVKTDNIVNGKLILQDERAGDDFVDTYLSEDIVEELEEFTDPRPLIFLSACNAGKLGKKLSGFGGFAKAFLDAGAGAFVGALWSIEDNAAFVFTKAWYDNLKAGKNLAEATISARRQASGQGDATYLAYVIYGHPNAEVSFPDT